MPLFEGRCDDIERGTFHILESVKEKIGGEGEEVDSFIRFIGDGTTAAALFGLGIARYLSDMGKNVFIAHNPMDKLKFKRDE